MVTPPCARSWRRCRRCCEPAEQLETSARRFAQGLVLTAQAALMIAHGNAESAALFVASRLGRQHGRVFGTLDADANMLARIAARAWPA
jgi:putative acyl-CoA dehydrogenase